MSSTSTIAPGIEMLESSRLVIDVRAPSEFAKGHVPGAVSLPLFDDEGRAEVGTLYKQRSREAAIDRGLELIGPKMVGLVQQAREWASGRPVVVYCWRGGMRSGSVSWLLATSGLDVSKVEGGYKAYRDWSREELSAARPFRVVGGMTGVGKTDLLHALAASGEQVLDLEGLASHYGSAFGNLEGRPQPSTEQFANDVHATLRRFDPDSPIWTEDESRRIGNVVLPEGLYERLVESPLFEIVRSDDERVVRLCTLYGEASPDALVAAFERIRKRLGGLACDGAIAAVRSGDLAAAVRLVLPYYDKQYRHGMSSHAARAPGGHPVDAHSLSDAQLVSSLLRAPLRA